MRLIRMVAWTVGLVVGALQAWLTRQQLSSDDAIAYLDIGDAYWRGDWHTAINAYWSPLYSWILGAALRLVSPSTALEFPIVKVVNLVIFVCAFVAFEIFWRRAIAFAARFNEATLSAPALAILGYGSFLWASLTFIGVSTDTPDMLVAALTYLAAAALIDLACGESRGRAAWLGVVLALGYLAKAVLFPMAIVFLVVAGLATRRARPVVVAATVFALLAVPFVAAISRSTGRLTFGDTGRLNYAWSMNRDVRPYRFWYRATEQGGTPRHPPRVLSDRPEVFEFAQPVGGTYPPWHDPSYWYDGLTLRVRPALLARVGAANFWFYTATFGAWLAVGWLALAWGEVRTSARRLRGAWILIAPATCGLGLYLIGSDLRAVMIPTQPSTRFVAAFVVLLAVAGSLALRGHGARTRAIIGVAGALVFADLTWDSVRRFQAFEEEGARAARDQVRVADSLRRLGLAPGDGVAISGYYLFPYFHALRLDRMHIVAEVFEGDLFWRQSPERRAEIIAALRRTGARAILQRPGVPTPVDPAWVDVGAGYHLFWL